jgi:Tfp pilus assembly protein PilX
MSESLVIIMKKYNSGFISAISLLIMAFLLLLTAAVVPRVGAELKFSSMNSDGVEAQYAAESGVKYAAAQILNNPGNTD